MDKLFTAKMNKKAIMPSLILLSLGFLVLITGVPFIGIFSIALAGLISLYLLFGKEGILLAYSKPQKIFSSYFIGLPMAMIFGLGGKVLVTEILNIQTTSNPVSNGLTWSFLPMTLSMLMGEELITLVLLIIIVNLLGGTKKALWIGFLISTIVFGLLHLPVYGWNIAQVLLMISAARIPFTWASLRSNSIWAGYAIHVTYDWIILIGMLLALGIK